MSAFTFVLASCLSGFAGTEAPSPRGPKVEAQALAHRSGPTPPALGPAYASTPGLGSNSTPGLGSTVTATPGSTDAPTDTSRALLDAESSPDPGYDYAREAAEEEMLPEPVLVDGVSVAIAANQRATIVGETESLRAVVEEICRQADIDLRAFGAPDRRYAGKLENVPLTDALRSILRTESYLVWLQASADGASPRVKWMRVLGTQGNGGQPITPVVAAQFATPRPAATASPPPPPARFSLSTALLFQAFGTFDPVRRDQAQREIIERISQPNQMERFLSTDTTLLVSMFGRYRDSELTLARLKSLSDRAEVQAKFDDILNQMAAAPDKPAGGASRR